MSSLSLPSAPPQPATVRHPAAAQLRGAKARLAGAPRRRPLRPGEVLVGVASAAAGLAGALAAERPRPRSRRDGPEYDDEEWDYGQEGPGSGGQPPPRDDLDEHGRPIFKRAVENSLGRPLSHSAELIMRSLGIEQWRATRIARVVQRWAVQHNGEDPTGTKTKRWARRLCRGLQQHPMLRRTLLDGKLAESVFATLEELEKRSNRHGARVAAIERQHRANRDGEDGDKEEYSRASAYMGEEWWMRAAHGRVAKWIDEYFLLTPEQVRKGHHPWAFKAGGLAPGWKRYTQGGRVLFWNPETKRMQTQEPEFIPRDAVAAPLPREPPVSLLDVGSCSNPFLRFPYLVEPTALDLQPLHDAEDVMQADFFDVPIVVPDEGEEFAPGQRVLLGEDGKLEGIVAGAFDVVVLSLVLSYVPDPRKRMEMIARARRCLRDDRGLLFVIEVGSALADASWYVGDAAADWSRAIEEAGFRTKLFEDNIKESYPPRQHRLLQWVFETAPLTDKPLKPLMTPREMPW